MKSATLENFDLFSEYGKPGNVALERFHFTTFHNGNGKTVETSKVLWFKFRRPDKIVYHRNGKVSFWYIGNGEKYHITFSN